MNRGADNREAAKSAKTDAKKCKGSVFLPNDAAQAAQQRNDLVEYQSPIRPPPRPQVFRIPSRLSSRSSRLRGYS
jgi:hypothetical protein